MPRLIKVVCLLTLIVLLALPAAAETKFVAIGTGGVTGVYYPVGKAIAKLVNRSDAVDLKVSIQTTGGSVFNINSIMSGDLDFGIAQSDAQYHAWRGSKEWQDEGPQKDLRSVFSLHSETFILMASEESGIKTYPDLKGKAVAVGNPGSGQRLNFSDVLATYGMSFDDFGRAEGLKASESAKMLQDGRIDAFVYTVGNPNGLIKEATSGRIKTRFIAVDPAKLEALAAKLPFYVPSAVPIEYYPRALNETDPTTLAVKATLVTRAAIPDEVVYAVTKEVMTHLDSFRKLHPALAKLGPEEMLRGLTAPLHPGAERYFKEAGLIK